MITSRKLAPGPAHSNPPSVGVDQLSAAQTSGRQPITISDQPAEPDSLRNDLGRRGAHEHTAFTAWGSAPPTRPWPLVLHFPFALAFRQARPAATGSLKAQTAALADAGRHHGKQQYHPHNCGPAPWECPGHRHAPVPNQGGVGRAEIEAPRGAYRLRAHARLTTALPPCCGTDAQCARCELTSCAWRAGQPTPRWAQPHMAPQPTWHHRQAGRQGPLQTKLTPTPDSPPSPSLRLNLFRA